MVSVSKSTWRTSLKQFIQPNRLTTAVISTICSSDQNCLSLTKIESSTLDALRTAYVLVVKRQNFHLDFLRISKETEERMAEPGFKTMFFYGL